MSLTPNNDPGVTRTLGTGLGATGQVRRFSQPRL